MWSDVTDFNQFYRSRLGIVARARVMAEIRARWPSVSGETVVGLGYATPYLTLFSREAARVLAVMPAHQGVTRWPSGGRNRTLLAEETALPLDDLSIDRLLLVHALENSEHLRALMRECWRVLSGQGRMLIVVPSRSGIWSRTERSPFGHGKPYSHTQIMRLLKDSLFEPLETSRALYMLPSDARLVLQSSKAIEHIGRRWFPRLGGVLVVEAQKQVYSATPASRRAFRTRLFPIPAFHTSRSADSSVIRPAACPAPPRHD